MGKYFKAGLSAFHQPGHKQQNTSSDDRADDLGDDAGTEIKTEARKQKSGYDGAEDANNNITYETEAVTLHNYAR